MFQLNYRSSFALHPIFPSFLTFHRISHGLGVWCNYEIQSDAIVKNGLHRKSRGWQLGQKWRDGAERKEETRKSRRVEG